MGRICVSSWILTCAISLPTTNENMACGENQSIEVHSLQSRLGLWTIIIELIWREHSTSTEEQFGS